MCTQTAPLFILNPEISGLCHDLIPLPDPKINSLYGVSNIHELNIIIHTLYPSIHLTWIHTAGVQSSLHHA